jgi:hypothetical protein
MALVKCNHCRKETKNDTGKCRWCNKKLNKDLEEISLQKLVEPNKWICPECSNENTGTCYSCKNCNKISNENLPLIKIQIQKKLKYKNVGLRKIISFLGFFLGVLFAILLSWGKNISGDLLVALIFIIGGSTSYFLKFIYTSYLIKGIKKTTWI